MAEKVEPERRRAEDAGAHARRGGLRARRRDAGRLRVRLRVAPAVDDHQEREGEFAGADRDPAEAGGEKVIWRECGLCARSVALRHSEVLRGISGARSPFASRDPSAYLGMTGAGAGAGVASSARSGVASSAWRRKPPADGGPNSRRGS